jgi:SPP1 gp7 family putative phage head morphogenesis protein
VPSTVATVRRRDPTKAYLLRKRMRNHLDRRFARLQASIVDLVQREDAFGLGSYQLNEAGLRVVNDWSDAARAAALAARRRRASPAYERRQARRASLKDHPEVPHGHDPLEHEAHRVHSMHEAHEVAEHFGGGHEAVEGAVHEAAASEATGAAIPHPANLDAHAIIARHLYGPATTAVEKILKRVPGARGAGEKIAQLHESATRAAEQAIHKLEQRYGRATTGAILAAGGLTYSAASHGLTKAVPGQKFVGAVPYVALAEAGKRLGFVGPNSKLEKGLSQIGTWVHAVKHAIGKLPHQLAFHLGRFVGKAGRFAHVLNYDQLYVWNAFCPTGEGGGVDPSCSSKDSVRASAHPHLAAFFKDAKFGDPGAYIEHSKTGEVYGPFNDADDARGAIAVVSGAVAHPKFRHYKYEDANGEIKADYMTKGTYGKGELLRSYDEDDPLKIGKPEDLKPHPSLAKHPAEFVAKHFEAKGAATVNAWSGGVDNSWSDASRAAAALARKLKGKLKEHYARLEQRYGPKYAKLILASALIGVPLPFPGASFATAAPMVAAAELHRWIHNSEAWLPVWVDFDRTITAGGSEQLPGVPLREGVVEALSKLRSAGVEIGIYTANPEPRVVKAYLKAHGVPYDHFERKPPGLAYVDDLAVPSQGDWLRDVLPKIEEKVYGSAVQPFDSWDQFKGAQPGMREELIELLEKLNFPVLIYDDLELGQVEDAFMEEGGTVLVAPDKAEETASAKVESDYRGDWTKLLDPVRATVALDTVDELWDTYDEFTRIVEGEGGSLARAPEDYFREPLGDGYRMLLANYTLPSGAIVEVQYNLKGMLIAKERAHLLYDQARTIRQAVGDREYTPAEAEAIRKAESGSKDLYARAWHEATGVWNRAADPIVHQLPMGPDYGYEPYMLNAFCPTGPGGGVDSSCSAVEAAYRKLTGGKRGEPVSLTELRKHLTLPRSEADRALVSMATGGRASLYTEDNPIVLRPEDHAAALKLPSGHTRHWMYMNAWTDEGKRIHAENRWKLHASDEKVEQFKRWLDKQWKADDDVWEKYIEAGWRKGAGRAFDSVRTEGHRDEFLRTALGRPVSVSKLKALVARTFEEYRNLSSKMRTDLSRVLADSLVAGYSPSRAAQEMVKKLKIGLTSARRIATTEFTRAHAEGQLEGYKSLGVKELGVDVEFQTRAGPDGDYDEWHVCPECQALDGTTYSVEDASGVIPAHIGCMCAFVPSV